MTATIQTLLLLLAIGVVVAVVAQRIKTAPSTHVAEAIAHKLTQAQHGTATRTHLRNAATRY